MLACQRWKDLSKAKLEQPLAIHRLRILTHPKEEEDEEPRPNLDPSIEIHRSFSRNVHDLLEIWPMHAAPAIRNELGYGILVEDKALDWEDADDQDEGHPEQAHEAVLCETGV